MESEKLGKCPICGADAIYDFWSRCIECTTCFNPNGMKYPRFKFDYTQSSMERLFATHTK